MLIIVISILLIRASIKHIKAKVALRESEEQLKTIAAIISNGKTVYFKMVRLVIFIKVDMFDDSWFFGFLYFFKGANMFWGSARFVSSMA
jgi:hypothetical protein